jgi:hypothetical protein
LVLACQKQYFPDDETATAFGFRYFVSADDRLRLLHLYCRLVNEANVGDEELREAWQKDVLRKFILFRCYQMRREEALADQSWIRQHERFGANVCTDFVEEILNSASRFLSAEDKKHPFTQLSPLEKRQALTFYGLILNGYRPDADEDNWISLGFWTAPNDDEALRLQHAYATLIQQCQLDEFWTAMTKSTMVQLFESMTWTVKSPGYAISRISWAPSARGIKVSGNSKDSPR